MEGLVTCLIEDELNVKDALLRVIDDPSILDRLNDEDTVRGREFLQKEIKSTEEELASLVNENEW